MLKTTLLIFCACWWMMVAANLPLQAQDSITKNPVRNRYLVMGLGLETQLLNDEHMSPMNYRGAPTFLQLGVVKEREKSISRFWLSPSYGVLRGDNSSDARPLKADNIMLTINYQYLRRIGAVGNGKYQLYLGGKAESFSHVRINPQLDNSLFNFTFANGFSASGALTRSVRLLDRDIRFYYQLDLPLFYHTIRPQYLNIYDYVNPEQDWIGERLEDSQVRTITSFQKIHSLLELQYPVQGGNLLTLSYHWDFYHIASEQKAQAATHGIALSFFYKF